MGFIYLTYGYIAQLSKGTEEEEYLNKATSFLRKAVELDPNNAEYYYYLSFAYEYSKLKDEAINSIEKAAFLKSKEFGEKIKERLNELRNKNSNDENK